MTEPDPQTAQSAPRMRRRVVWACVPVIVVSLAVIVVTVGLIGRHVAAPDWLRERIETRLEQALPNVRIGFGELALNVQRNGLARIVLLDVEVTALNGAPIVSFSSVQAGIGPASLLKGRPKVREVRVSGAFVTMRRDREGRFGLSIGHNLAPEGAVPSLPGMVDRLEAALGNSYLERLNIIEANALTFRYEDARARRAWTVDGGVIRMERAREDLSIRGDFAVLNGKDTAATVTMSLTRAPGSQGLQFGATLSDMPASDIASQGPALAWLDALRAPISGALRAGMAPDGKLGRLSATLQIGQGVLQPSDETRPIPFSHARTYFTYEPETATLAFDEISVASSWGETSASGQAQLQEFTRGRPARMTGQFTLEKMETNPDGFFDTALTIEKAEMEFTMDLDPFRFRLGALRIHDDGLPLTVSGAFSATPEGWDVAADAHLDKLTMEGFRTLWPEHLRPMTRRWLGNNILGGTLTNGVFAIRARQGAAPKTSLDATIVDAEIRFLGSMPTILANQGRLSLHRNRLVVWVEKGAVTAPQGGVLDVSGTSFVVPNIVTPDAPAHVNLSLSGAIPGALSLLNQKPLEVMKRAGQPVNLASGHAQATARLDLALKRGLRAADVAFDGTARLTDVEIPELVKGKPIAAKALDVRASNSGVEISGRGTIKGVPFQGTWTQPLGQGDVGSALAGQIALTQDFANTLDVALPSGLLNGRTQADVTVTLPRGSAPEFALSSDLDGLGASVPPIGWSLSRAARGRLEIEGRLSTPVEVSRLSIEAGRLSALGRVALDDAGDLEAITFDHVRVGNWLDAPVTLRGRGAGVAPAIELRGGKVDLRSAPSTDSSGEGARPGDSTPIVLALDRMQISEGIALTDFSGGFDMANGLDGTFWARLNDAVEITGTAVPKGGRTAFQIHSDDAGAVLKAAGLIKTAHNGVFDMTLLPTASEGEYDGTLTIRSISLQDAPAIAGLLDAISIVGLLDELQGEGITFAEVEAEFRLTPTQVILKRSSATGASMGLSLDGYYDLASGQMDMQGVLSPLFMLNGIGSLFTRRGEGLIGFNFGLTGSASDPKVSVNPLSVLTPAMFREIFRRPAPKVSQ